MSGKPYTMKEMKGIVDYLIQQRAYDAIKGRKMWMEYANTDLTTRTWQSLKETFLKRILPDIKNPYYKLSIQQIESFQQGNDLESRLNNKLEICTMDDDSSDSNKKSLPLSGPSNVKDAENDAGEVKNSLKITENRSSAETVILESNMSTITETAAVNQKDLEPPEKNNDGNSGFKDYITYSNPVTPMIQDMLQDFATDDEGSDKEPQMQIVEDNESTKKDDSDKPLEIHADNTNEVETTENNEVHNKENTSPIDKEQDKQNTGIECIDITEDGNSESEKFIFHTPECVSKDNIENMESMKTSEHETQNNTNTTVDTLLPNNQEELDAQPSNTDITSDKPSTSSKLHLKEGVNKRKRLKSHETDIVNSKKQHLDSDNLIECSPNTQDTNKEKLLKTTEKSSEQQNLKIEKLKENPTNGKLLNKNSTSAGDKQIKNKSGPDKSTSSENGAETSKIQNPLNPDIILVEKNVTPEASKPPEQVSKEDVGREEHTDSECEVIPPKKEIPLHRSKSHRDRALGNVFGFSHGGAHSSARKNVRPRKRSSLHHRNSSLSSEWTSETEPEYVSPPRGRKHRQSRKYLRPKSARVLCLEEEGGLFVMHRKKIYPVVKDGKIIKNYLTYVPGNDSDNEDSFWKTKYVEEKKKTAELQKLLEDNKQTVPPTAPVADEQSSPSKPSTSKDVPEENEKAPDENFEEKEKVKEVPKAETVKIKFTKNNEEVQLEGHWSHINPVLAQVVQIFHKNGENQADNAVQTKPAPESTTKAIVERPLAAQVNDNSGIATPSSVVDVDVHDKVTELEKKIFKEIEEKETSESNVTKRKNEKENKSSTPEISIKEPGTTHENKTSGDASMTDTDISKSNISTRNVTTRRTTRTPRKIQNRNTGEEKIIETEVDRPKRKRTTKRSTAEIEEDDGVRYKLRSPRTSNVKTEDKKSPVKRRQKAKNRNMDAPIFSSPDTCMHNSIESTQGYQDSEDSRLDICLRKKRRLSVSVLNRGRNKCQRSTRRKPRIYMSNEYSSDSSNSFVTAPLKSSSNQTSSLNAEVYKSESYQLLFGQGKTSFQYLDKIEETSPTSNGVDILDADKSDASNSHSEKMSLEINIVDNFSHSSANDGEHSSNVSLPPSPVLSIVENLSVSKNLLNSTEDLPFENKDGINKYNNLDVDMSVPLMEQEGNLQKGNENETETHFNFHIPEVSSQVSDSFLNKVCSVNIKEPSLSDSIHHKLRDLLLESAKKLVNRVNQGEGKNEGNNMEVREIEASKKANVKKKRCSTPRKKQNAQKLKANHLERPLIEEEHMESCISKSCPPIIVTEMIDKNVVRISPVVNKTKARKKKDIIKVKILKPKSKQKVNITHNTMTHGHKSLLQSDSGINDTESGVFLMGIDDSVDLIHNHSDTCLNAHESMNDSVEMVDNAISVVSLNSNIYPPVETEHIFNEQQEDMALDIFCTNAQDSSNLSIATEASRKMNKATKTDKTVFPPIGRVSSANSLLTEDLSDESPAKSEDRISAWYLLSEDERSNTNQFNLASQIPNCNAGSGANLQQIFPITCAVPDLSTITEENTRKFTIDGDTRNEFDSYSLPNVN